MAVSFARKCSQCKLTTESTQHYRLILLLNRHRIYRNTFISAGQLSRSNRTASPGKIIPFADGSGSGRRWRIRGSRPAGYPQSVIFIQVSICKVQMVLRIDLPAASSRKRRPDFARMQRLLPCLFGASFVRRLTLCRDFSDMKSCSGLFACGTLLQTGCLTDKISIQSGNSCEVVVSFEMGYPA